MALALRTLALVEPLVPLWRQATIAPPRAGARTTARLVLENGGAATWRSRGEDGLQVSYHWLDTHGNAIVWDRLRTAFPRAVAPASRRGRRAGRPPRPPGRTSSASTSWRSTGSGSPRSASRRRTSGRGRAADRRRRLAVVVHGGPDPLTEAALAAQEEPVVGDGPSATAHLVAGAQPTANLVAPAARRPCRGLARGRRRSRPGGRPIRASARGACAAALGPGGRNPRLDSPLLLPSLVGGLELGERRGLPAFDGEGLFEGRAIVRLPTRSGRRPT